MASKKTRYSWAGKKKTRGQREGLERLAPLEQGEKGALLLVTPHTPPRRLVVTREGPKFLCSLIERVFDLTSEILASEQKPSPELSPGEKRLLDEGGFSEDPTQAAIGIARSVADYARLQVKSLTVARVAKALSVTEGRIRQRLTRNPAMGKPPTLYGIKVRGEWRLPAFQFARNGAEIPGIDRVLARLPEGLHPLRVEGWFTTPDPDLVLPEGEVPVSPIDWLRSGGDPEHAAELAADL